MIERQGRVVAGLTVGEARRIAASALRDGGLDSPDLDARVIMADALELDHAGLVGNAARPLSADQAERIAHAIGRRLEQEPLALILGKKEFWGLTLRVTRDTLVPRPDTETVVEAALRQVDRTGGRQRAWRIADLGTGTGAILLALLHELPNAEGVATDLSLKALAVAQENARALGSAARASFVVTDYGSALQGGFDLVVSNPPYIATSDIASLSLGVRDFEPRRALDGGADGLSGYRAIAADAPRLLARGGCLVVEIGQGQEGPVRQLFETAQLQWVETKADLAGIPRAVVWCDL